MTKTWIFKSISHIPLNFCMAFMEQIEIIPLISIMHNS